MKTKHTKGPWVAKKHDALAYFIGHEGTNIGLCGFYADNERTPEEAEANARLIAAAPELLECLKVCWDYVQANGVKNYSWAQRIRKALEAAEGGPDEEEDQ